MLNNFIYAETKDLFLEQLNVGNILNEAIVFIEDTKEIWNHGTFFSSNVSPFEKGDAENSAVLKGGNNQVISESGVALGKDNLVGLKGWYYSSIYKENDNTISVYLSNEQKAFNSDEDLKTESQTADESLPNLVEILGVNAVISLVNAGKYDDKFIVIGGSNGVVRLQTIDESVLPFDIITGQSVINYEDYSIYCLSKPDAGISDIGKYSFAVGYNNKTTNGESTAFGCNNHAYGKFSFVEGKDNKAGYTSHAEGRSNIASGSISHAEGRNNVASGYLSHAEGGYNTAEGVRSHAEGYSTKANGINSHAEGEFSQANGKASHSEGFSTEALGESSHAEGNDTKSEGINSHAEGNKSYSLGNHSHAEGSDTKTEGVSSHAEGYSTEALGNNSHAEGNDTKSEGINSHAEGNKSYSLGPHSHAEGNETRTEGSCAHAEGYKTQALGKFSHAEGNNTISKNEAEHACGKYNLSNSDTRFSIGIGTSGTDRKNAFEVKQNGDIYIEGVEGRIQDKLDKLVNITYSELKSLRNLYQLIPGQQYRITNYTTTTVQENTQSAGHQFDIIVVADDVNILNENARAIQHKGDSYFANSDLNSWELKYCLDNDTSRFAWADSTNGKGVIYYMKDEWNNECPYDFKNIRFARWELSNPVGYRNDYNFSKDEDNWIQESTPINSLKTGFYGLNGSNNKFYYGNNEEIGFYSYKIEYTIAESPTYCYTFGKDTDYSISGSNYGNVIKEHKSSNKIQLNNIVFLSNYCYRNIFGNNCASNSLDNRCYDNSFGNECSSNSFGNSCYRNSFGYGSNNNSLGEYCYNNSFGNYCYNNSFGNECSSNSFGNSSEYNSLGNECSSNSFGNGCYHNSFGNYCNNNSFGNYYSYNNFGNECCSNSFGNECSYNSFGEGCYNNSFGNGCDSNSFGNECSNNSLGNNCNYNSFGNKCNDNSFGNYCNYNKFGNYCSYNKFGNYCEYNSFGESKDNIKSYYRYIIFDNGNRSINLNCTSTTSSSKYYQNVRIGLGVNNRGSYKTINDSNVGQTYETLYKPANSQTITI